ncbi:MAG TPA: tungsten ABC transporter substrate-binding protein [Methanomicrobia archaeon]|nr:tungsten ABC transporter substrate-binding protein [Methanomicrobia archaeon]
MKRRTLLAVVALLAIGATVIFSGCVTEEEPAAQPLILSTTTSLYDTGLLDHLKPVFDEQYNADLRIVYAGTGKALEYGMRGDVDVLAVHDRAREDQFIADGYGVNRRGFAYNYFVIVGPESDPAGIQGMTPEDAFKTIREKGMANPDDIKFVSRGDASGTHAKEQVVWKSAGFEYGDIRNSTEGWYVEAGSGMGPTLVMASEKFAYTLSDIGTFLAFQGDIQLVPLVDQGEILLNVYGVMAVNPEHHPHVNSTMATHFINFLISDETQQMIGEFGVAEYGRPLFYPLSDGNCPDEVLCGCPTLEDCFEPVAYAAN